jgi:tetraprenyl-beta-curcumene synthase
VRGEIAWAVGHVLTSPRRLRYLLSGGVPDVAALGAFLVSVVPRARAELREIRQRAETIEDPLLRRQALDSISAKSYHAAGAAILAAFLPGERAERYVDIVVPLESIYDYLDNLCDRHPAVPARAYPVLHGAIADALDPEATPSDYYAAGPSGNDSGYLRWLVDRVRSRLRAVEEYERLLPHFREAALLYGQMQTFVHLPADRREAACIEWFSRGFQIRFPTLTWDEFACAAGSQFQVYGPLFELFRGSTNAIDGTYAAYFPAISALHVFLDSFIDQAEDRARGDLNFAGLRAPRDRDRRVALLGVQARRALDGLERPAPHRFVLRIMALFYLTHPKIYAQGLDAEAQVLLGLM